MRALVGLLAGTALIPATTLAVATPDPTTMRDALADAPSADYVEADTTVRGEGPFDPTQYAQIASSDSSRQQQIEDGLNNNHFVAGYGRVWVKRGGGVVLVEQIFAFATTSGAESYEGLSKLGDTTTPDYQGTIDTSSIPHSYGTEQLNSNLHSIAIAFDKGNDVFGVVFVSSSTYMVAETQAQAQAVYTAAPDYTIRPSTANTSAYDLGRLVGNVIFGVFVLGVILLVVGLVVRNRRRAPAMAIPGTVSGVQMSADGHYWWDGAAWRDSTLIAPAHAQRSPDGAYWWDGQAWHLVPKSS